MGRQNCEGLHDFKHYSELCQILLIQNLSQLLWKTLTLESGFQSFILGSGSGASEAWPFLVSTEKQIRKASQKQG